MSGNGLNAKCSSMYYISFTTSPVDALVDKSKIIISSIFQSSLNFCHERRTICIASLSIIIFRSLIYFSLD